ncbi:MAG: DUF1622 domain-containing protein [Candidatus Competibacteraceae bacterium]|nr:DUF1622 domain-containing protein [Candidatus Competibacteraceae bacterium]
MNGSDLGPAGSPLEHWFDAALHWIALAIEAAGVVVIVLGALVAVVLLLLRRGDGDWQQAYYGFRTQLARSILLGLEFLVAADIIGTVAVEPTLDNLTVLGLIVLIRTFLSFSLEVEINGRWPWQEARDRQDGSGRKPS